MRAVTAYEAKPDDCLAASDEAQTDLQARQRQKQRIRPGATGTPAPDAVAGKYYPDLKAAKNKSQRENGLRLTQVREVSIEGDVVRIDCRKHELLKRARGIKKS